MHNLRIYPKSIDRDVFKETNASFAKSSWNWYCVSDFRWISCKDNKLNDLEIQCNHQQKPNSSSACVSTDDVYTDISCSRVRYKNEIRPTFIHTYMLIIKYTHEHNRKIIILKHTHTILFSPVSYNIRERARRGACRRRTASACRHTINGAYDINNVAPVWPDDGGDPSLVVRANARLLLF